MIDDSKILYPLIDFYLGKGKDGCGRTINEVRNNDLEWLEDTHNYIQWLFPLIEKSQYVDAPVLDDKQIELFKENPLLYHELLLSFKLMLNFYGFSCDNNTTNIIIIKSPSFNDRKKIWISRKNHNYLRITRIIKCLSILGLENYAQAFFECLQQVFIEENIDKVAFQYWKQAVN